MYIRALPDVWIRTITIALICTLRNHDALCRPEWHALRAPRHSANRLDGVEIRHVQVVSGTADNQAASGVEEQEAVDELVDCGGTFDARHIAFVRLF